MTLAETTCNQAKFLGSWAWVWPRQEGEDGVLRRFDVVGVEHGLALLRNAVFDAQRRHRRLLADRDDPVGKVFGVPLSRRPTSPRRTTFRRPLVAHLVSASKPDALKARVEHFYFTDTVISLATARRIGATEMALLLTWTQTEASVDCRSRSVVAAIFLISWSIENFSDFRWFIFENILAVDKHFSQPTTTMTMTMKTTYIRVTKTWVIRVVPVALCRSIYCINFDNNIDRAEDKGTEARLSLSLSQPSLAGFTRKQISTDSPEDVRLDQDNGKPGFKDAVRSQKWAQVDVVAVIISCKDPSVPHPLPNLDASNPDSA